MPPRFADQAGEFFGFARTDRAVSAGLVILLHILILALLFYGKDKAQLIAAPRGTILTLLPFFKSAPPPDQTPAPRPREKAAPVPEHETIAPVLPAEPDATVLGPALNGCSLENLENLTPEQQSACSAYQNDVVNAARAAREHSGLNGLSRSRDAAHWAETIVKRNTPGKVDCTSLETVQLGVQSNVKSTNLMVDLSCAARHLVDRKSPLN